MSWEIRRCSSREELRAALWPITHYFGQPQVADEHVDRTARVLPPERAYAAWDGGQVVGGAGALALRLTVPGGRLAAAASRSSRCCPPIDGAASFRP